jgi:DNA-binding NarL/FixJ family response regulator
MITVMLADDHHVVRQGLRVLLEAEADFQIVAEASDGLEVIPLVEKQEPDILVLDLMLPGLSGLEVAHQISQRSFRTRVVVLSMYGSEAYVANALQNGASGYILKKSTAEELTQAIREVMAGRRYLSSSISKTALDEFLQQVSENIHDAYDLLTNREREVFHLLAEGYNNPEIAQRLTISPRTAEMHRGNVMRKLGVRSVAQLVYQAVRRGILPLEG